MGGELHANTGTTPANMYSETSNDTSEPSARMIINSEKTLTELRAQQGRYATSDRRAHNVGLPAVVLIGKTGSGKSTLGNMLLGADAENGPFRAANDFESVSKEVQLEDLVIDDIQFKLIDTPGIFDTVRSDDEIFKDMGGIVADAVHGIQAIIFVFEAGRFTHEQESVIENIKDFLGESSLQHMIFAVSKCTRNQTSNPATLFSTFTPPLRAAIEATGGRWTVSPNPDLYEPTDDIFIDTMERLKSMIVSIPQPYTSVALERVRREHEAIIRHHEEEVERNRQLYLQAVERVAMEEAREEQRQEQGELQTQMELNNLRREMAIIEARYKESLQAQEHNAQQREAQLQAELNRLDGEVDRLTMERGNETDDGNVGGVLRLFERIISTTGRIVSTTVSTISSAVKSFDSDLSPPR